MENKAMLIPTAIDEYPEDLTWELDDGSPAVWCNSKEEITALEDFVTAVVLSESIDVCLPLSEPLEDLCPVSSRNLVLLKQALKKSGGLHDLNKRLVRTFEESQELAPEGRLYGLTVTGMSGEAFELLCRFFHSCIFNNKGDATGWKNVNGAKSEIMSPEGRIIKLRVVQNDIHIETAELLIILVNGLPGYTGTVRILDLATKTESKALETRIGIRTQVSIAIIANCLVTGQRMEYHWIFPILEFAEEHRVFPVM